MVAAHNASQIAIIFTNSQYITGLVVVQPGDLSPSMMMVYNGPYNPIRRVANRRVRNIKDGATQSLPWVTMTLFYSP